MTTEEKAKAYEEALERAKEIKEKIMFSHLSTESCKAVSEYINTIIPELAESEDERMVRAIEHILYENYSDAAIIEGIEIAEIVAWLEKQKEQKPAEWIEDSVKFEEGFKTGRESGLRDGQKYVLNNLDSYGLCKPAEWSEKDEEKREFLIKGLEDRMGFGWASDPFSREELISWLGNLHPSWKPSEEQMSMLLAVINDPRNAGAESCQLAISDLYQDLKKL